MKLTRRQKEAIGFSMLISALVMMVSFLVLAFRKRSIWAALLAIAAAEGVAGYLLLTDPKPAKPRHGKRRAIVALDDDEELFDETECREADAHIRQVLGGTRRGGEAAPRMLREIPRDEEATEADFQ